MSAVRTWREAARILSMDEDTLSRHRKRWHDDTPTPPWFRDADEVIAWYRALRAPTPQPAPTPRRRSDEGAIDPRDVARELTKRR